MAAPQLGTALKYLRRLAAPRMVREQSDSQLLEDFSRKHSEDAFVELMKRYGPLVWRVCRHRLGHNQDAEDAFQATFLVLALKAGTIKKRHALASWLHGAAYRSASQIVRQTARRRRHEQGAIAMARTATSNENTWRELQAVVDEELQRLPEKYRAPFVLCCLQEKTKTEAARQLGWKEGTVSGRLALARKQLQKRLIRRGIGLSLILSVSEVSNVATAEVSAKLATATVEAAMAAAGRKATAGLVSSQVAAVVEALTKATATGKLKLAAFLVFSVGLIATGAEVLSHPQTFQRDSPVPFPQREAPAEEKVANPALARVAGRVVDEQGQPVADAVVSTLEPGTTIKRPTTKSAADGSFLLSLDQPAARYVTLLATVGNGVRQGLVEITDTDSPLGNSAQVRIVMKPTRTIRVRVTDGQGKAVKDAAIEVFNTYSPLAGAATGADGRAALRVPVDAHVLWVVGVKPFLGFDYFENYRSWPGYGSNPPPTDVSLVLEGARTVRIQATDSKGRPVPGMAFEPWILAKNGKITNVNLSGAWSLSSIAAKTDREGIATFNWIPKQLKGGVQFIFGGKGYCLPQNVVSFDLAREQDLLTARILKNVTLRGKVRFPDGKPAPGILIQAEGRGRMLARSGADGSYAFETDPQCAHVIAVTDDSWAAPSHNGISVEEGKTLEHLDFRLERGTLIHGQVTVGRNGKPAPGQTVTLTDNTSGFLVRWASTDKNGHYQFRVGPGIYQIWAEDSKHEGLTAEKQDKIQMNFHLERLARGSLAGTVRTSRIDGKPVAKAIIQGESIGQQGHAGFKVVADSQGRFQTERCRGRMNLYATDPQGSLATFKAIGEEDETVDIVLLPAGSLTGRLVDSKGNPWQGIRVVGWMTKGPREALEGQGTSEAMTDREGRFTLVGLVVGTRCLLRAEIGASIETKEVEIKDTQAIPVGDVAVEVK